MTMLKLSGEMFLFLLILGYFITNTRAARCCFSYSQRPVRCSRLKSFYIQEIFGNCDIRAVIFETRRGKFICADPKMRWTQDRITCLQVKSL